jgi:putative Holliday junction resolvase
MTAKRESKPDEAEDSLGRLLAIDYGRRRIGLAVSDELQLTAQPLETLERANRRKDMSRLREVVRKWKVTLIVVGHPLRMDGTVGEMAEEVELFVRRLRKELAVPVTLSDERLSSWEAEQTFEKPKHRRGKKREMDSIAAAVILRDYLERKRESKTK